MYISHEYVTTRIVILLQALALYFAHPIEFLVGLAHALYLYKIVKRIIHVLFLAYLFLRPQYSVHIVHAHLHRLDWPILKYPVLTCREPAGPVHRIQAPLAVGDTGREPIVGGVLALALPSLRFTVVDASDALTDLQLSLHVFKLLLLVAVEWRGLRDHVRRQTRAGLARLLNYLYFIVFQFLAVLLLYRRLHLLLVLLRNLPTQGVLLVVVTKILCLLLFFEDLVA